MRKHLQKIEKVPQMNQIKTPIQTIEHKYSKA